MPFLLYGRDPSYNNALSQWGVKNRAQNYMLIVLLAIFFML
jgi:hypothetical protein